MQTLLRAEDGAQEPCSPLPYPNFSAHPASTPAGGGEVPTSN